MNINNIIICMFTYVIDRSCVRQRPSARIQPLVANARCLGARWRKPAVRLAPKYPDTCMHREGNPRILVGSSI